MTELVALSLDPVDPVFGLVRLEPDLRCMQVRGNLASARHRYVVDHAGANALEALATRLDPEASAMLLAPPAASEWVSMGAMMDVDRALIDGPMGGDASAMRAFGAEIAAYDVSTIYKAWIQLALSPRYLLHRIVPMLGSYFAPVENASIRGERPGEAIIRVPEALPLYLCEHGISGWATGMLELASAENPSVEHTSCIHRGAQACEWTVRWD